MEEKWDNSWPEALRLCPKRLEGQAIVDKKQGQNPRFYQRSSSISD